MPDSKKKKNLIMWQPMMVRMLYALAPVSVAAIYFFGWKVIFLLAICTAAAFFTEYVFCRSWRQPVSSAVFVTSVLFVLSLPPTLPFWMALVGIVFGMIFGKMVFGGFGRNVFNPALVGRAFIYVCFPNHMNSYWANAFTEFPAGLAQWGSDTITLATPMTVIKSGGAVKLWNLVIGTTGGSFGETCGILIILGGIYIIWKKSADWRIVVSGLAGFLLLQVIVVAAGAENALPVMKALFAGSFLFGLMFFITEPVSASSLREGKYIYGFLFGALVVIIRTFSVWREGTMFAVLLCNVFAPIMDYAIREYKKKKKAKAGAGS